MSNLDTFRSETRAWLEANAPASLKGLKRDETEGTWGGKKAVYENPDEKVWLDIMAEKGWTAPTWPRRPLASPGSTAPGAIHSGAASASRPSGRRRANIR